MIYLKKLSDRRVLLLAVIIIASFLRLYNIGPPAGGLPPGLYPDEAMNGNNALETLSTGHFKIFYPENNGREGLFINIQAISLKIFGNEPWALRVVSAIFGILTVLGVYFLAKELFSQNSKQFGNSHGEKIALLSAFLLAVSFWHINFSRIGFRAIMAPFFMTWALYFLLTTLNKTKEYSLKDGAIHSTRGKNVLCVLCAILGGILFGLGFHSYIAYRGMPLLILVILILYWFKIKRETGAELYAKLARKRFLLAACLFLLSTFIVFLPLGLYFLENPDSFLGRTTQVSIFNSPTPLKDLGKNILKTAAMFNVVGDWNWRHNYAGRPELFWPVGVLFLLGFFLGLRIFFEKVSRRLSGHGVRPWSDERSRESSGERLAGARDRVFREEYSQAFVLLFVWLILAALPVVVSNEALPHALRSILMIPPVFILAGYGGVWLYRWATKYEFFTNIRMKKLLLATCYLLLATFTIEAYHTYFIKWAQNPNVQGAFAADYLEIGRQINLLPKDLPKYVIVEASGVLVAGVPMPAQTVMFITDTFTLEKQKDKNIYYVLPSEANQIPPGSYVAILK